MPHHIKTKKPFRLVSFILVAFVLMFASLIIFISVRGKMGNPTSSELYSVTWKENGPFELSPERGRFALTSSLVERGTVTFSPDLARFTAPDVGYRTGQYVSLFAPLLSFLVMPGYYLGKIYEAVQVGTFLNVSFFAICNLFLIYLIGKKLKFGTLPSLISGLIFLFATPSFAYGVNLYQHHVTVLFLLISILLVQNGSFLANFGIFFFWMLSVSLDYPNAFMFAPLGIVAGLNIFAFVLEKNKIRLNLYIKYLFSVFGVFLPMIFFFWFNSVSYGGPLNMLGGSAVKSVNNVDASGNPIFVHPSALTVEELKSEVSDKKEKTQVSYFVPRELVNGLYTHLLSRDRGIIYFTPVIILGLIGAFFLFEQNRKLTVILSSVVVADLLIYSMWGDPWGGWAFGSRYLIPAYSMLAIFLGAYLNRMRKYFLAIILFLVLAGYSIYVNTAGALSTSANPPQVQVLELEKLSGRRERYSWDRNLEYLKNGNSKSFVYQTWFQDKIQAYDYFRLIAGSIAGLIIILTIAMYLGKGRHV